VKADEFANALYDYFDAKMSSSNAKIDPNVKSPHYSRCLPHKLILSPEWQRSDDEWAFQYIHIRYAQPIVEAIDSDVSGFLNFREINIFTTSRQRGWRYLISLAFYSADLKRNITVYYNGSHTGL